MIRRFTAYRVSPPPEYYDQGVANPPDQPQFEGVEFTDGIVVVRWLTEHRSVSVWTSMTEMLAVHGHPEYGSRIEWADAELVN
jgi:hypothetical protein